MLALTLEDDALGHPLSSRRLTLGRGVGNDIALADDAISARHAAIWMDGEGAWVQDLQSRNGTFVNEQRVTGLARAVDGDVVRVGQTRFHLRWTGSASEEAGFGLTLEDLDTGVWTALPSDRMRLGDAPGVDLHIPGAPEAVLGVDGLENLWIGIDGEATPLYVGTPFSLGGRMFVLRRDVASPAVTREMIATRYAYRLEVWLEGGPGPKAVLTDLREKRIHTILAENRAILLWVLVRQRVSDQGISKVERDQGWCDEGAIIQGVWGRSGGGSVANLRVLLCRIRRDVKDAGFDPWFLEHRAAHVRVRVEEARLR